MTAARSETSRVRPRMAVALEFRVQFPVAGVPTGGYRKLMIDSMSGTEHHNVNQPALFAPALPPRTEMERAFFASDASYDGIFVTGVRTKGIFCRPS